MKAETIGHAVSVSFVFAVCALDRTILQKNQIGWRQTEIEMEGESLNQFLNSETGMNFNDGYAFDRSHVRSSCWIAVDSICAHRRLLLFNDHFV